MAKDIFDIFEDEKKADVFALLFEDEKTKRKPKKEGKDIFALLFEDEKKTERKEEKSKNSGTRSSQTTDFQKGMGQYGSSFFSLPRLLSISISLY